MKKKKIFLFCSALFVVCVGYAQRDSIIVLDEVILSDAKLLHFSNGIKAQVLSDSLIQKNDASLTDLLRFNSPIYFKENGYGMISSPSLRGTNASQTAVIWNGLNLNSQLTGQTDFNTIIAQGFDEVVVRLGGGSVQYGSGAIGGTILLNNKLDFSKHFDNRLKLGLGSFVTQNISYKSSVGNESVTANVGVNYISSENNYKYLGTDDRNENGEFKNANFNIDLGVQVTEHHLIKFFNNTFLGDRNFSGTLTAPSNDRYKNTDSRSLLEWDNFKANKISRLKLSHLYEQYKYFGDNKKTDFTFGRTNTFIFNYDYKVHLGDLTLNGIADVNTVNARGTSIESADRQTFSSIFLLSHTLTDKFTYGVNFRKDFVSNYQSPALFSLDTKYQFTDSYGINLNASKNYRIPTFNDLYWVGAGASGNLNVLPETSMQAELGQNFQYKKVKLNLTAYYILSEDLIQWRPVSGIWTPVNIADASQYGAEAAFSLNHQWTNSSLLWSSQYEFTKSINNETQKQLLYVPKHKVSSNVAYAFKNWSVQYQFLYTGSVFTTTDNSADLDGYFLSNINMGYTVKSLRFAEIGVGFKVRNLFNEVYENVAFRPMPNRNYQVELIIKF